MDFLPQQPPRPRPDALTVSLSMVNWLALMALMSAFLLAATVQGDAPTGTSSEIGSSATR